MMRQAPLDSICRDGLQASSIGAFCVRPSSATQPSTHNTAGGNAESLPCFVRIDTARSMRLGHP